MAKPLDDLPSSKSTGIMGITCGGALACNANWDDFAEGSVPFSWRTNVKDIPLASGFEK